jgi:hypothetical protein
MKRGREFIEALNELKNYTVTDRDGVWILRKSGITSLLASRSSATRLIRSNVRTGL